MSFIAQSDDTVTRGLEMLFYDIEEYHQTLGYPVIECSKTDLAKQTRDLALAMIVEVTEALDATPWKPWRPSDYKETDRENLTEELVDILFFFNAIRSLHKISWPELAAALNKKLLENHSRIERGYNNMKGEHR